MVGWKKIGNEKYVPIARQSKREKKRIFDTKKTEVTEMKSNFPKKDKEKDSYLKLAITLYPL